MGREGWQWESLSRVPLSKPQARNMTAHAVVDGARTICVSTAAEDEDAGTYCFDTVERERRRRHADWVLPFARGAEHVPDLELWLGFTPKWPHHPYATSDLAAMDQHRDPVLQHVWEDLDMPKTWSPIRLNLINLGGGRFCVAKIFEHVCEFDQDGEEFDPRYYSPQWDTAGPDFVVLTGVEAPIRNCKGYA